VASVASDCVSRRCGANARLLPFGRVSPLYIQTPCSLIWRPYTMKRARFRDVPTGTRFTYKGRVFLKLRLNLATDEGQRRTIFASETEVEAFDRDGGGSGNKDSVPGNEMEP
jgi:hypothetical protein